MRISLKVTPNNRLHRCLWNYDCNVYRTVSRAAHEIATANRHRFYRIFISFDFIIKFFVHPIPRLKRLLAGRNPVVARC